MLAKVIAWAPTRHAATRRLATALAQSHIHGLRTNRDLLVNVLRHPAFVSGDNDTSFLDQHGLDVLAAPLADEGGRRLAALAAALAQAAASRATAPVLGGLPSGWRNVASAPQVRRFLVGDDEVAVAYSLGREGLSAPGYDDVRLVSATPERVVLDHAGVQRTFEVAAYPALVCVVSSSGPVALVPVPRFADPTDQTPPGSLLAPLPGSVVRVAVSPGEAVVSGQVLLWLEAMKMQHEVRSPSDGIVAELPVFEGQQVEIGAVLVVVQPEEST
jgi:propionyl-CoA carboxylase alpha chain